MDLMKEIQPLSLSDRDDWCNLIREVYGEFLENDTMDFLRWEFQNWFNLGYCMYGTYLDSRLVCSVILKLVKGADFAFVRYLVVSPDGRRKGLASEIVTYLFDVAKRQGLSRIWYVTTRTNQASLGVARKIGFLEINQAGYAKFEPPYPLDIDHEEIEFEFISPEQGFEILSENPEIVPTGTIPAPDENFEFCTLKGLQRLGRIGEFLVLRDESGAVNLFLYCQQEERDAAKWRWITVFGLDKNVFKIAITKQLRDLNTSRCEFGMFLLGPRAKLWLSEMEEFQTDIGELVLLEKKL